ncbi:MAG: hypothetical protein C7B44_12815 [Sulfobacillus thermosulfidooxidans]|nr:MAG: hypothetical protein C7B44_12815 [Sulfobacillus thermosulfidooxidans]
MPIFRYYVDDEEQLTDKHEMTPTKILIQAQLSPEQYYLEQIDGAEPISYKDDPNWVIHMHQDMHFVSVYTGPTTLS